MKFASAQPLTEAERAQEAADRRAFLTVEIQRRKAVKRRSLYETTPTAETSRRDLRILGEREDGGN